MIGPRSSHHLALAAILAVAAPALAQVDTTRTAPGPVRPSVPPLAAAMFEPMLNGPPRPAYAATWAAPQWSLPDSSRAALSLFGTVLGYGFAGAISSAYDHRRLDGCDPFFGSTSEAALHGALAGAIVGAGLGAALPPARDVDVARRIFGVRPDRGTARWARTGCSVTSR